MTPAIDSLAKRLAMSPDHVKLVQGISLALNAARLLGMAHYEPIHGPNKSELERGLYMMVNGILEFCDDDLVGCDIATAIISDAFPGVTMVEKSDKNEGHAEQSQS